MIDRSWRPTHQSHNEHMYAWRDAQYDSHVGDWDAHMAWTIQAEAEANERAYNRESWKAWIADRNQDGLHG